MSAAVHAALPVTRGEPEVQRERCRVRSGEADVVGRREELREALRRPAAGPAARSARPGTRPSSAFVLLSRICCRSGKTRVGVLVRWFWPGELYCSVSLALIWPDFGNIANSGPFVFVLLSSDVPAAAAAVVLLPAVHQRVAVGVGRVAREGERRPKRDRVSGRRRDGRDWFPVGVTMPPLLSTAPPLSVSPTKPDAPAVEFCSASSTGTFVAARVPREGHLEPGVVEAAAAEPGDGRRRAGGQDRRQRRQDAGGGVVDAVRDRRRDVAVVVQRERVVRPAVVRLLDRGEAAAAAQVDELEVRHVDAGRRPAVGDREAGRGERRSPWRCRRSPRWR